MRLKVLALAAASAALLSACATIGNGADAAPIFDGERLSEHIRILSDDSFEGRGIATPAEDKVIRYLSGQYAAAGFQPGGPNGAWTQDVVLNRFTVSHPAATLSVGDWSQTIRPGQDMVFSTRLPGSRVDLRDAPLVFVGYGIKAPERQWDDFKGQDMRGKILVVLVNDADFEEPALNTFNGRAMTYYGRWTYKYEEAARQGAAGVIIVHETGPASYGWATVNNSWSGPQFDILRQNAAAERIPVESWIQRDLAVEMFRHAGLDFDALKVQARSRDFQPVALTGARLNVSFDVASEQITTHNVIARLPGTTHPDETILFTGHWDHIGIGDPDANGDRMVTGADYTIWADNFGKTWATFGEGDANGDRQVTGADYTIWADNFGQTSIGADLLPVSTYGYGVDEMAADSAPTVAEVNDIALLAAGDREILSGYGGFNGSANPVPEPSTVLMGGLALAGLAGYALRRRSA